MLPEGWVKKTIGDLLTIGNGKDYKHLEPGDIPVYGTGGYMTSVSEFLYDGESVCIGRKGTIDKPVFLTGKFWTVDTLFYTHSFRETTPKYIYYNFQRINWKRYNEASGVPSLSKTTICEIPIIIPPLPEQKKIAQILSTWDNAISATERLLENSQQRKKALMQQLLTGKKRLPGFEGEWESVRLKKLLKEEKNRNRKNTISRVLSVTNHSGFVLPEDQFAKRVASENVTNYKVVLKGQYGYNPSRINVGSFARLDDYKEGLLSPMYVVFSVIESKLNNDYFLNWMKSDETRKRIAASTQGTVRDSVGFDSLCNLMIKLPSISEQKAIARVLTVAAQEIDALQKRVDHLKQEKKALMQQLLTGKRRVQVEDSA